MVYTVNTKVILVFGSLMAQIPIRNKVLESFKKSLHLYFYSSQIRKNSVVTKASKNHKDRMGSELTTSSSGL